MVFVYLSPLRLFLAGRHEPKSGMTAHQTRSIWLDAFDLDWPGDLALLPISRNNLTHVRNSDLPRVKSRSMYERLCRYFPKATEANHKFAKRDRHIMDYEAPSDEDEDDGKWAPDLYEDLRLRNIPMRHMWLDLLNNYDNRNPYMLAHDCVVENHAELLRHLINTNKVSPHSIDYLHFARPCLEMRKLAMDYAARHGFFEILKIFHDAGCNFISTKAMDGAAEGGHLDVVKWLHENRSEGCTNEAMDEAAARGHLEIVKFLHENRKEGCTANALTNAASKGRLEVVGYLIENCTEGSITDAMNAAVQRNQHDVINFLSGIISKKGQKQ